jgi:histidinol-phosphate aminotransferase
MKKNKFWSQAVQQLTPYIPGEQPISSNLIKLNTNENPYAPSPKVREAIISEVDDKLRLYPDPDAFSLKNIIANNLNIQADQIFVGNGSDEVLAHIFYAFFKQSSPILFPDVTYSFYKVYCSLHDIPFEQIPLAGDLSINTEQYKKPNGGIIFPNPNAPTGRLLSPKTIEDLLRSNKNSVLVVDEAYIDFGGTSSVSLISSYPNLLITQSLSKSRSLAGLRVGFAFGHSSLIEALDRVKNSFNSYPLDRLAIIGGMAAFGDTKYFNVTRKKIIKSREKLSLDLIGLGFKVLPSAGNFLFITHKKYDGAKLTLFLRENNILIRHFDKPRIRNYLRITIGLPEQNEHLVNTIKKFTL